MGELIAANADVDRVADHILTAHQNALGRGGDVSDLAKTRLGPSAEGIEKAVLLRNAARKAEAAAWAIVMGQDDTADNVIGTVRDEMWNALGRPSQSPSMDEVFPGGIGTYTAGNPAGQPLLMQILHSRILAAGAPQWPDQKRLAWAASIEAARVPYEAAVAAHRPTEASVTIAEAGYRAAVRAGHTRLRAFKRDLKNLGLTETQIHEIIPDAGADKKSSKASEE